jgi:hypothetical protein
VDAALDEPFEVSLRGSDIELLIGVELGGGGGVDALPVDRH